VRILHVKLTTLMLSLAQATYVGRRMRSRRIKYFFGATVLTLGSVLFNTPFANAFSGAGAGTLLNPYMITSCLQLQEMEDDLGAHYKLNGDIDCSATSTWNSGLGFNPVGDNVDKFTGNLDGNGHTISNLYINRADDDIGNDADDESYIGIIGYLSGGSVKNVTINSSKVKGYQFVGGVVGYADADARLENISFNTDTADNTCDPGNCVWARYGTYGGGIVGYATSVTLTNVYTGGPVKGSGNFIGGIVGFLGNSSLANSSSISNVDGGFSIGGVAGDITNSTVTDTTASGNALGQDEAGKTSSTVGGFAGSISYSQVSNSSASGNVEATGNTIGGFAGFTGCETTFNDVHASGSVIGANAVGGFAGWDTSCGEDWASRFSMASATGTVEGAGTIGGFIGSSERSSIYRSFATGTVTVSGGDRTGGFVGYMQGFMNGDEIVGTIDQSYATGRVIGANDTGGFVGSADGVSISNSFSRGLVDGVSQPSGFVGAIADNGLETIVTNSYAANQVNGVVGPQGLIGKDDGSHGSVTGSFWDSELGPSTSHYGDAKTTTQMKTIETFTRELGVNGWNFESIWGITAYVNDGYPCLQWSAEACNDEDLNGDGIPDSLQPNIGGYISSLTGKQVAIDVGNGCELTTDDMTSESQLSIQDPAFEYGNGLWDFEADCGTPGHTTTITLYYYDVTPENKVLRKHSRTTNAFFTVTDATISTRVINGKNVTTVSYQITDGGDRDTDGIVDGFITDPAGLASLVINAPNTGLKRQP
jgi:hypothetical protein